MTRGVQSAAVQPHFWFFPHHLELEFDSRVAKHGRYIAVAILTLAYPFVHPFVAHPFRANMRRMFSMHVLAFGLYVPLLALASPTPPSQYQFPPELSPKKLSLVRENAIKISNERSVHVPTSSPPSCPRHPQRSPTDGRCIAGKSVRLQRH